jgi:hypothetical protein
VTQIICALTPDCVFMVSDRLLTYGDGRRRGQTFLDEECKLVSLGNFACIGYTGLARMGGRPTHEWIAKKLAEANTVGPGTVAATLAAEAPKAFGRVSSEMCSLTFLLAGWWWFSKAPRLEPFYQVISNAYADNGELLAKPSATFRSRLSVLSTRPTVVGLRTVGIRLHPERMKNLHRTIRRHAKHAVTPKETLRLMVDEVRHTHASQGANRVVGDKVLAVSIPKRAADAQLRTGQSFVFAADANRDSATFGYFDPSRDDFLQFGPTFVLGDIAHTGVVTESDPSKSYQSVRFTILHRPTTPEPVAGATPATSTDAVDGSK